MKDSKFILILLLISSILVYAFIEIHVYIYTFTPPLLQPFLILAALTTILGLCLISAPRTKVVRRIVQFSFLWSVPPYILAAALYTTSNTVLPIQYSVPITILLSTYTYTKAKKHVIEHITVLSKTKEQFKIVQITDIHLGDIWGEKELQQIVEDVKKEGPDIVVITGDISDGVETLDKETYRALSTIDAPVLFVTGNHDIYYDEQRLLQNLKSQGVKPIDNTSVELPEAMIAGIKYGSTEEELLQNIQEIPSNKPFILLQHEPNTLNVLKPDIMLSGHTHNCQIWPLKYIAKLHFKYLNGLYRQEETAIYVSPGTKTWGPPYRIGTQSEITSFNFIPSNK